MAKIFRTPKGKEELMVNFFETGKLEGTIESWNEPNRRLGTSESRESRSLEKMFSRNKVQSRGFHLEFGQRDKSLKQRKKYYRKVRIGSSRLQGAKNMFLLGIADYLRKKNDPVSTVVKKRITSNFHQFIKRNCILLNKESSTQ